MKKNKKTVLVTGGAGFIGSQLCELLLEKDFDVLCLDNFYTGRKKNIEKLIDNPNFEYIRHDITIGFLTLHVQHLLYIISIILLKQ